MSWIDASILVIALGSLVGLIWVLRRKLAVISTIDTNSLPAHQANQVKGQLLEERFARNVRGMSVWVARQWQPLGRAMKQQYASVGQRLKELERKYALPEAGTPGGDEALKVKVSNLIAQARAFIEDEQYSQAEQVCLEIIGLQKLEPTAYRLLGEIYEARREYVQAKEVYEFLLKLNEQDPVAHRGLGHLAVAQGAYEKAAFEFSKTLEVSDTAGVHLDLADVYEKLGDKTKALAACQDALVLEPRSPKILDRFFQLAIVADRLDLARDAFTRLQEVNPENQKLAEFAERLDSNRKAG